MTKLRELRFNAFNMTAPGHNWAGLWSHPRDRSIDYNTLDYWVEFARIAERGLFDGIFLADVFGVYDVFGASPETAIRHGVQLPNADPTLLVSAMALVTQNLGFGICQSIARTSLPVRTPVLDARSSHPRPDRLEYRHRLSRQRRARHGL